MDMQRADPPPLALSAAPALAGPRGRPGDGEARVLAPRLPLSERRPAGDLRGARAGQAGRPLARALVLSRRHPPRPLRDRGRHDLRRSTGRGRSSPGSIRRTGVLEDFVTVLDPAGRLIRADLDPRELREVGLRRAAAAHAARSGDIFHTNTLEVLDGRFAGRDPAFRKGNLLLSVLQLDTLAVLDPEQRKVVWARTRRLAPAAPADLPRRRPPAAVRQHSGPGGTARASSSSTR